MGPYEDAFSLEQHAETGQMLFDLGSGALVMRQLDVCGHLYWLNAPQRANPALRTS